MRTSLGGAARTIIDLGGVFGMLAGAPQSGELPVRVSLGFADRNALLRFALPVATLRGAMKLARP